MVLGAAAKGIGATLNSSPQARTDILRVGGHTGLVDAYLAIEFALLSVMAAAFGVATVLRLHADEAEGRAEAMLAGPVSRIRWAAAEVVLGHGRHRAADGGGRGVQRAGLRCAHRRDRAPRWDASSARRWPRCRPPGCWPGWPWPWFGLVPRVTVAAAWTVLAVVALVDLLGRSLGLSQWLLDLTPFAHVPALPGGHVHRHAADLADGGGGRADRGRAGRVPPPRPDLIQRAGGHRGGRAWPSAYPTKMRPLQV